MKNNRKCVLCGKEYSYCGSGCRGDASKPTWMKLYHSENCRNIFNTLNDFNFKLITKAEAKERLSVCDLTIELNDHYRGEINDIMVEAIDLKPRRGSKIKAKIIEEDIPEEIIDEVVEQ